MLLNILWNSFFDSFGAFCMSELFGKWNISSDSHFVGENPKLTYVNLLAYYGNTELPPEKLNPLFVLNTHSKPIQARLIYRSLKLGCLWV